MQCRRGCARKSSLRCLSGERAFSKGLMNLTVQRSPIVSGFTERPSDQPLDGEEAIRSVCQPILRSILLCSSGETIPSHSHSMWFLGLIVGKIM